jgi:hypothetical protein
MDKLSREWVIERFAAKHGITLFVDTDGRLSAYPKTLLAKHPGLRKLLQRHYYAIRNLIVSRSL